MKRIVNLKPRLDEEIPLLTKEVLDNLLAWREAQEQYRLVKAQVVAREQVKGSPRLIAEQRAASHAQISEAISFTAYYGSQVSVAATALLALTNLPKDLT